MTPRAARPLAVALTAALLGAAVPATALASGGSAPSAGAAGVQATVQIDNCKVKRSRNAGGFTWFYCGVVSDAPAGFSGSVKWSVNMPVFNPHNAGTFSKQTGTYTVSGGQSVLNLKFAVRNKTVAQVTNTARVTLSNASPGLTITDASARIAAS